MNCKHMFFFKMQLNEIIEIICQIKNNLPRKFQNRGIKLWIAISIFILIFSTILMNWTVSKKKIVCFNDIN